jgi:NAD(P)-dependent dehydrogenase (short-subunit alcohol dehydrogenase family)
MGPARNSQVSGTTTNDVQAAPRSGDRSLQELISLKGRSAFITGGAKGLGYAAARRFAEAGASVVIGDIDLEAAREAAATIGSHYGSHVHAAGLDVRDTRSVSAFADEGLARFGKIDIWVNNAGIYPGRPLLETDDAFWETVQDVNLKGAFIGSREAGKRMVGKNDEGVIINVASVAAVRGRTGLTHYSAAKSGVLGLTRGAAVELAPHRIRVLCVVPALADTPGSREMRAAAQAGDSSGAMLKQMEERVLASFPLRRIAQADEVARVIVFCASDLAAFMTGSAVFVDGGLTAT